MTGCAGSARRAERHPSRVAGCQVGSAYHAPRAAPRLGVCVPSRAAPGVALPS